ncbi:protein LURP-one-related 12-like [Melia azedarach]|uniref:Protein LURP-one-related 12-like n=1 Tax=Melia azedarach TaxID=155640 RepID=A0ACC1XAD6_MELAZ|nr:protein LURP-one-related 12-like [Melia azedarach]
MFSCRLKPGFDGAFTMGLVLILDQMYGDDDDEDVQEVSKRRASILDLMMRRLKNGLSEKYRKGFSAGNARPFSRVDLTSHGQEILMGDFNLGTFRYPPTRTVFPMKMT